MSEFAGKEFDFAAGSIKGLRSWNMDAVGRLHGVTHKQVWRPGENIADCKATREVPCPALAEVKHKSLSEDAVDGPTERPKKKRRGRDHNTVTFEVNFDRYDRHSLPSCGESTCYAGVHQVPTGHDFDPDCQCGFWAYDEAGFSVVGKVVGVIEGYGKATIGTKGFRVQKARILAFAKYADDDTSLTMSEQVRLAQLYPEAEFFEDVEALTEAHIEVLREWPEVGPDFWDKPVPEPARDLMWQRRLWSSLYGASVSPMSLLGRYSSGGVA